MEISNLIYQVITLDGDGKLKRFLGTAFKISPDSGLVTCRHVVDIKLELGECIAIRNYYGSIISSIVEPIYWNEVDIDLAYLKIDTLGENRSYFPIIDPSVIKFGEEVYSFGYYSVGMVLNDITPAYFKGNIVNYGSYQRSEKWNKLFLSYAIIEGMSGSPILEYHNGVKVVGICIGSDSQRVVARELVEFKDTEKEYKETINRIVELGVGYHTISLIAFLQFIPNVKYTITSDRVSIPGIE